ncbi:MAG: ATPase, T2SS/T4P/T4SS family [Pirellulales bacterium]
MPQLDETLADHAVYRWLKLAVATQSSDIHALVGYKPSLRTHGRLIEMDQEEELTAESLLSILAPIMTETQKREFDREKNWDYAIEVRIDGRAHRFRINLFLSMGGIGGCIRVIPDTIPDFQWSNFPKDLAKRIAALPNGLVLFSGVTGSGKSTSLAQIIHMMNQAGNLRILTIEDPVEYKYPRVRGSLISQREVGDDVDTFADGLRFGLRQDPDVILVGEIRDVETARMALSAAETGHLVLSTIPARCQGANIALRHMFLNRFALYANTTVFTVCVLSFVNDCLPAVFRAKKVNLPFEIVNTPAIGSAIRLFESIDNYILTGR